MKNLILFTTLSLISFSIPISYASEAADIKEQQNQILKKFRHTPVEIQYNEMSKLLKIAPSPAAYPTKNGIMHVVTMNDHDGYIYAFKAPFNMALKLEGYAYTVQYGGEITTAEDKNMHVVRHQYSIGIPGSKEKPTPFILKILKSASNSGAAKILKDLDRNDLGRALAKKNSQPKVTINPSHRQKSSTIFDGDEAIKLQRALDQQKEAEEALAGQLLGSSPPSASFQPLSGDKRVQRTRAPVKMPMTRRQTVMEFNFNPGNKSTSTTTTPSKDDGAVLSTSTSQRQRSKSPDKAERRTHTRERSSSVGAKPKSLNLPNDISSSSMDASSSTGSNSPAKLRRTTTSTARLIPTSSPDKSPTRRAKISASKPKGAGSASSAVPPAKSKRSYSRAKSQKNIEKPDLQGDQTDSLKKK